MCGFALELLEFDPLSSEDLEVELGSEPPESVPEPLLDVDGLFALDPPLVARRRPDLLDEPDPPSTLVVAPVADDDVSCAAPETVIGAVKALIADPTPPTVSVIGAVAGAGMPVSAAVAVRASVGGAAGARSGRLTRVLVGLSAGVVTAARTSSRSAGPFDPDWRIGPVASVVESRMLVTGVVTPSRLVSFVDPGPRTGPRTGLSTGARVSVTGRRTGASASVTGSSTRATASVTGFRTGCKIGATVSVTGSRTGRKIGATTPPTESPTPPTTRSRIPSHRRNRCRRSGVPHRRCRPRRPGAPCRPRPEVGRRRGPLG